MPIDKVFKPVPEFRGLQPKPAQYFVGDGVRHILRSVGLGVEHDHAQRITVLAGHQIGDGGFIVGAVEVGLSEGCAEPAVMIDDNVVILGRTRNNRGP